MSDYHKRLSDIEKRVDLTDACPTCGGRPSGRACIRIQADNPPDECPDCGRPIGADGRALVGGYIAPDGRLRIHRIILSPRDDDDTHTTAQERGTGGE